ncbi:hypothetical protein OG471_32775 [Streptomyces sp. NBC_01336]|uniref:hypothetical protein n=1 Tax=Streptomyces sp. NBC_01336 TaxID=2903829 RepID=UPI002E15B9A9|nr:hypothetical protein OG471_32775 [Streptomyces sp. NBC_01336]
MRSLRLILSGLVLTGTVFVLTALLVPQAQNPAAAAVTVFCSVWFVVALLNATSGINKGHPPRLEAGLAVLVFAAPTAAALALWSEGGLEIDSARTPWILTTGVALWAVILQLVAVRNSQGTVPNTQNMTVTVFLPLWLLLMLVNMLVGLRLGYTLTEELSVLSLNFGVPAAVAAIARACTRPRTAGRNTARFE